MYPSPLYYANPDMQASRHGHVFIPCICARWVYAHTCVCVCKHTNERLQLEVFGVEQYCVLHYSLTSVLFTPSSYPPPSPPPPTHTHVCAHTPKGFSDGSRWRRRQHKRRRQRLRKTSCSLCNLNTLCNILMILGRNVEQDKMTRTRMITLAFLFLELFPFVSLK